MHHNVFLALFSLHTKTTFVSKQASPAAAVLPLPTVYEYFRDLSTFSACKRHLEFVVTGRKEEKALDKLHFRGPLKIDPPIFDLKGKMTSNETLFCCRM